MKKNTCFEIYSYVTTLPSNAYLNLHRLKTVFILELINLQANLLNLSKHAPSFLLYHVILKILPLLALKEVPLQLLMMLHFYVHEF